MTYLITFACYGNHLPGAEGWVDRLRGNCQRGGTQAAYSPLEAHARTIMRQAPQTLTQQDAQLTLAAIHEVCQTRNWHLLAAHIRTTHAHLIADGIQNPTRAMGEFKAYATRSLRQTNQTPNRLYWARGGFIQWLRTTEARRNATHYVLHNQGEPMAIYKSSHI